jgi:hypothetical protein
MPQRPSVGSFQSSTFAAAAESSDSSRAIATLHPVVQAALENLDIQLEEELLRYRRSRHSAGETWRNKLAGHGHPGHATSIPLGAVSYATNPDGEAIAIRPDTAEALAKIADRFSLPAVPTPEPLTDTELEPEVTPEISFDATAWNQTTEAFLTDALPDPTIPDLTESSTRQPKIVPPQPPSTPSSTSSSTSSSTPAPDLDLTPEDSLLDTLLTPLGIGSMLLLLVSSATLGFAMMNPANLSFLANIGKSKSAVTATATANAEPGVSATDSAANPLGDRIDTLNLSNLSVLPSGSKQGSLPAAPPSTLAGAPNPDAAALAKAQTSTTVPTLPTAPNLAGSLSQSLSTVPIYNTPPAIPDISEAAISAPSYAAPSYAEPSYSAPSYSAPSYSAPSYSAPPRISYVAPAPRAATPPAASPEPYTPPPAAPLPAESTAPETIVRSEAAPTDLDRAYHVDTPYLGDPVLGQAREEAPDAYVYNGDEGTNIRASFATEAEAESYSQKLEDQGLSTSVQVGDEVQ